MTHSTAPGALAAHLGQPVTALLLSDRRGSRAWKVTTESGRRLALKANSTEAEANGRDKAAEVAHETAVLAELERLNAIEPGYVQAVGTFAQGRWLALRWINGRPLWRAWALARGPEGDRPSVRPWLLNTARTLAERLAAMHTHGWTHADVQPTNILADPEDGTGHLIDYALACGPEGAADRPPYRGALTHTTPPEIAAEILDTDDTTHIQATPSADVWSLGATLTWCWTGQRPFAYPDHIDRMEKLRVIAAISTSPLKEVRPWPFPALEALITACLVTDPASRPTMAEVVGSLSEAAA
ncbi:protein kinase domain-containing protein [Streptomyces lydicus]|uniref:protein kinase domain-containing protein n=1 Tax=Streptomyces lydicus TaxID=47763 RepID=UPI0036F97DB0